MSRAVRRAAAGAATAQALGWALRTHPPGGSERWQRANHRGAQVSLLSGPALAVATAGTATAPLSASLLAGLGAGLVGAYDDAAGAGSAVKGFRGHLAALRSGTLTAGGVKLFGISAVGLLAAARLRPRTAVDVVLGGAVVAGAANLVNLFDLRSGRSLKVGMLTSVAIGEPGIAGACLALLPDDLAERTMLGDAGANALGAVLGVCAIARLDSRPARATALLALGALTAASERVSFSAVIDSSPPLRWFDQLGRRP